MPKPIAGSKPSTGKPIPALSLLSKSLYFYTSRHRKTGCNFARYAFIITFGDQFRQACALPQAQHVTAETMQQPALCHIVPEPVPAQRACISGTLLFLIKKARGFRPQPSAPPDRKGAAWHKNFAARHVRLCLFNVLARTKLTKTARIDRQNRKSEVK